MNIKAVHYAPGQERLAVQFLRGPLDGLVSIAPIYPKSGLPAANYLYTSPIGIEYWYLWLDGRYRLNAVKRGKA